jgi:hypothetical protein
VLAPVGDGEPPVVRACIDLCGLVEAQQSQLADTLASAVGVSPERVRVTHSHSHASGWYAPDRIGLPGGDLIPPYLLELAAAVGRAGREAAARLQDATISYGVGRCDLAANRDYWDDEGSLYACGYNPDEPADDTVVVGRVTDRAGQPLAFLVNYGCHPTTLAWENSKISPDYVGAMREVVEAALGAPCIFAQGVCGDLGPRHGYVGDLAVADKNGRQLGYAALAALSALGPSSSDFVYDGPVVSGATLGTWSYHPQSDERIRAAARFRAVASAVELPLKERPSPERIQADLEGWEAKERQAAARGDERGARDARAMAERSRRWLARLADLPAGTSHPLRFSVDRLGDAIWITCGGEPYNVLQRELRQRFPNETILVSPLASNVEIAYLLPRDRYGKGLYQEEPSALAPGCLELLTDAIASQIESI